MRSYKRNGLAVEFVFDVHGSCRIWFIVGRGGGGVTDANGLAEYGTFAAKIKCRLNFIHLHFGWTKRNEIMISLNQHTKIIQPNCMKINEIFY